MHVNFNPDGVEWKQYFAVQTGGGQYFSGNPYQRGYGAYFSGVPYQQGYGFGSVVGSIVRFLLPMLASAGRELGKEGLATGARILTEVAKGKNVRNAVVDQTSDGIRNLVERNDPKESIKSLIASAQTRLQKGQGKRRRKANTSRPVKRYRRQEDLFS